MTTKRERDTADQIEGLTGPLPIDEIHERFTGRTVLLDVLELDENQNPVTARVLKCWNPWIEPDKYLDGLAEIWNSAVKPKHHYRLTRAGRRRRSGPVYEQDMQEFVNAVAKVIGQPGDQPGQ
jgi:hypothetical protein